MATNSSTTRQHEFSVHRLKTESSNWLSEIAYWRFELNFFFMMLEKISVKSFSKEAKKKIVQFQNLNKYFTGELLAHFEHGIGLHLASLGALDTGKTPLADQLSRELHLKYASQMKSFEAEIKNYRKDLCAFGEQFI